LSWTFSVIGKNNEQHAGEVEIGAHVKGMRDKGRSGRQGRVGWEEGDIVRTSLLLSLLLEGGVPLDSGNELLSALGVLDVLDSEVDSLLHVSVSDDLEDDDSDTSGRDVVDDTGLAVVELLGRRDQKTGVGVRRPVGTGAGRETKR
jgi:hypothetical protein